MKENSQPLIIIALVVLVFLNGISFSAAEDLISADNALKKIFREATRFDSRNTALSGEQITVIEEKARIKFQGTHSTNIQMYLAKKGEQTLGFAFEDIVIGKWGPIHYLIGLDSQGTILDVIILDYQEIRGRPIAKSRFLRQYKHKTVGDPVILRKDIDGITGATISSRSLTNGIRKLLHVFEEMKKDKKI